MAETWILRGKREIFSLRLFYPDELQESQWGLSSSFVIARFSVRVARAAAYGAPFV